MKYKIPFFYDYVFPNMILPNALVNEYGVVNYIQSLYSTKNNLEHLPGRLNMSSDIFDNKLGEMNNSLSPEHSHLTLGCYSNNILCYENSIYHGKKSIFNRKYIYPIRMTPHIKEFIGVDVGVGNKMNGEYFWKHMSSVALKDAQDGNAIILLDYAQENFVERHSYVNLHEALRHSGIPKSQIILAFNSFNAKEIYEEWFPEEERRLEVMNWPFVMAHSSHYYRYNSNNRLDVTKFKSTRDIIRKNYFLFKIRRLHSHRLILLFKMYCDNLLDKSDWSCLQQLTPMIGHGVLHSSLNSYNLTLDSTTIDSICSLTPHQLQTESNATFDTVSAWTDVDTTPHQNSYFYVCTETYVHGSYKSLTEKVFKPIINFQPFLFMAYPGALKLLRSLGFKTFEPFINESYDDKPDKIVRLDLIHNEIKRLCSMSKEEIHEWYWGMEDILIHNHNHMLTVGNNEPNSMRLIKYMYDRISS